MPLSPLTLNVTSGIVGRPFTATIAGKSAGSTIEIVNDGTPGFGTVNGRVTHSGLPYDINTVVLRETLAGEGFRDSRIDILADGVNAPDVNRDRWAGDRGMGKPVAIIPLGQSNTQGAVEKRERGAYPQAFRSLITSSVSIQSAIRGDRGGYFNVVYDRLRQAGYAPTILNHAIGGMSAAQQLCGFIRARNNNTGGYVTARPALPGVDRGDSSGDLIQPDGATKIFRITKGQRRWLMNSGPTAVGTSRDQTYLDFVLTDTANSAPDGQPGTANWATASSLPAGYAAATVLDSDKVTDGNYEATLLYAGGSRHRGLLMTGKTTTGSNQLTECTRPMLPGWQIQGTGLNGSPTVTAFDYGTMTATLSVNQTATGTATPERVGYGVQDKIFGEAQSGIGWDRYGILANMEERIQALPPQLAKIVLWMNTPQSDFGLTASQLQDVIENVGLFCCTRGLIFMVGLDIYLPAAGTANYDKLTAATAAAYASLKAVFPAQVFQGPNLYTSTDPDLGTNVKLQADNTHALAVSALAAGRVISDSVLDVLKQAGV